MRVARSALCLIFLSGFAPEVASADKLQPAVEQADRDEAQRRLVVGRRLYEQGDLTGAERELLVGQQLDPLPVFNYTLGQIERQLGRCNRAIDYYRAYIKSASASQRASTQVQINRCQEALAEKGLTYRPGADSPVVEQEPPRPPVPVVVPATPPPEPVVVVAPRTPARHWYRDSIGLSLVGGGAAFLIAGAVLTRVGEPSDPRATYGTFEQARDRRWMAPTGIALLSVGGGLVIGGAVRLALVARRASR